MSVTSVIIQPGSNSLFAAYRPIILRTVAATVPKVVFCDIYFGGVFYKTISKTMYAALSGSNSEWQFDIQDAAQEYLLKYIGANGGSAVLEATPIMTKAQCKFRASTIDGNGFIQPEPTMPQQATSTTPAVPGTGYLSNVFYIVNATLQHEDNQTLSAHLNTYKNGDWDVNSFPLSHRPNTYKIGRSDSDYYPAAVDDSQCIGSIALNYSFIGQSLVRQIITAASLPCGAIISGITTTQSTGSVNVTIGWDPASNVTGYVYRIDGGAWIANVGTSVLVSGLSVGSHNVEVAGVCSCSQGAATLQNFTIINPVTFVCASVVSAVTATQFSTGEGVVQINWTTSGSSASSYKYRLDSGLWIDIVTKPFLLSGLTPGSHTIEVQNICSNGVGGNIVSLTFTVYALPELTKINETNTGPGGIRTQYFEIGPNVNPGNVFALTVYSHIVFVTAISGDTPASIAAALRDAINATSTGSWNSAGSAPSIGTTGFPPTATATGNQLVVTLNFSNSFAYSASLS